MFCKVEGKSVGLVCASKSLSSFSRFGHPAQQLGWVTFHKKLRYLTYGKHVGLKNEQIDNGFWVTYVISAGLRVFIFPLRVQP